MCVSWASQWRQGSSLARLEKSLAVEAQGQTQHEHRAEGEVCAHHNPEGLRRIESEPTKTAGRKGTRKANRGPSGREQKPSFPEHRSAAFAQLQTQMHPRSQPSPRTARRLAESSVDL